VFRKDKDSPKTHCARGGGIIFAVRCNLRCLSIGCMGLVQVNNLFNNLHTILDLVFVSADINFSLVQYNSPISNCDIHHSPLLLGINLYSFAPSAQYFPTFTFNKTSLCDIRNELSAINWKSVLSHISLE